jgi:DNA-binding MarR family transcriptional regulator
MNAITFATKRAYHGFLRLTRKGLAAVGLTAARFDMLLAIRGSVRKDENYAFGIAQGDLSRALGVSKSVVSRMLKSLEALELVMRCQGDDRRYKAVWMTEKGEAVFRAARDMLMRSVQRVVLTAVCFGQRFDRKEHRARLHQLGSYLTALRVYLGDKAPVVHDWTQPPPFLREYAPPAIMLRDWQPAGTPWPAQRLRA